MNTNNKLNNFLIINKFNFKIKMKNKYQWEIQNFSKYQLLIDKING